MARHKQHTTVKTSNPIRRRLTLGCIMLIIGALCITAPFTLMALNSHTDSQATTQHAVAAQQISQEEREQILQAARDYNTQLAQTDQTVMGENTDPFTTNENNSHYDEKYLTLLNNPDDGMMATISYPRLGINLPVAHGTSASTLDSKAGHLYGTSLPVGGTNTHTVISAHSGMADKLFFDRLQGLGSKAEEGDVFYITVLDQTLAYKVTSIQTVNPDQFDQLKIQEGKDLATLLTCTPYGVNTKRLLVTGERVHMPDEAPEPEDAPQSNQNLTFIIMIAVVWLVIMTVIIVAWRRQTRAAEPVRKHQVHKQNKNARRAARSPQHGKHRY